MTEDTVPEGGFLLLWRKFFDHTYWTEKRVFNRAEAWIDCVGMAAFGEHKKLVGGLAVPLARGEFLASERFLERRWRWSRGKVRRFLANAMAENELRRVREVNAGCSPDDTSGGTIYVVANYELYQPRSTSNRPTNGPATDQRETRESKVIPLSSLARAIGDMCQNHDLPWKLGVGIGEWAADLEREPKYAGLDLTSEVKRCDEYWQAEKKHPLKAVDRAIRNWLNNEIRFAKERAERDKAVKRNGTDSRTQDAATRRVFQHAARLAQLDLDASTTVIG